MRRWIWDEGQTFLGCYKKIPSYKIFLSVSHRSKNPAYKPLTKKKKAEELNPYKADQEQARWEVMMQQRQLQVEIVKRNATWKIWDINWREMLKQNII